MRAHPALARAAATALTLTLTSAPVLAAPVPAPDGDDAAPEEPAQDPKLAEAQMLFEAGVARYAAADYETAIDLWLDAYALIPATVDNQLIKAQLIYNVARAQQKWYDIDHDIKHLRQSKEILEGYRGEVDEIYGDQAGIEREKVDEQIAEVDDQITQWEAEQARREQEILEHMRPNFDEEADAREERRNKSMLGAGAALTALGAGAVGLLVTGIVIAGASERQVADLPLSTDLSKREAAIGRGRAGNAMILTGSLGGAVFLAAGVPLLAVSLIAEKKRKQRRVEAGLDARLSPRLFPRLDAAGPLLLPGGGGLGFSGRF
ncbi:MAG: hypothetical protein KC457_31095 [Myxococcales bacterium]|nr:hypothetical protein [Myxococcales bacterium]